jgi:23S rRNA (cytidine2498-2'-O)-methyltransferase
MRFQVKFLGLFARALFFYLCAMDILLQCRPGFEREAAQEVVDRFTTGKGSAESKFERESGFVRISAKAPREAYAAIHWKDWIFVRQWWCIHTELALTGTDRLNPILLAARNAHDGVELPFSDLFLEMPDTNEGRQSKKFLSHIEPLIFTELEHEGLLDVQGDGPRLCLFFISATEALVGVADERSAPWSMGFPRLRFPAEAPSRSTLKLAEAFEVFLSPREQDLLLRSGMKAVDLGAAPGGWTWQLLARGMRVTAVDNCPLKGGALGHPSVTHLKADGFCYRPKVPVDWVVCDMVEQPGRVADLMLDWMVKGYAQTAIFNLKLQKHPRLQEVRNSLETIRKGLLDAGIRGRLIARQLYHDREEITVYLRREGKAKASGW